MADDDSRTEQPREPERRIAEWKRQQAEGLAALELRPPSEALSLKAAEALNHELRVHQIELEMQNEQLRSAQEHLEASRARYFDLWDLAPVGYLILDEDGTILESNLTAANLLGVDRGQLPNRPLSRFILREDADLCYMLRRQLRETGVRQVCEVRMVRDGLAPFWARLEAMVTRETDGVPMHRLAMIDITEQRQALESLLNSERQFRTAFEHAPVGMSLSSPDGAVLRANRAFAEMLGRSEEELVGRDLDEPTHPDDLERSREFMRRFISEGSEVGRIEKRYVRPDGQVVWADLTCAAVRNPDGTLDHFIKHIEDITARKLTEEALRESEERYRGLYEAVPGGLLVVDNHDNIIDTNAAAQEMLGPIAANLVGVEALQVDWEAIHEDGSPYPANTHPTAVAIRTGQSVREAVIGLFSHSADRTRWLQCNAEPWRDRDSGEVMGAIVTFVDITARRRAEEALRESEERYRQLFMQAPMGIGLLDSLTGRFLAVNPTYAQIAGRTVEELTQTDWMSITHPDDIQTDADHMASLLAGDTDGFQMEKRYLRPEGTAVWVNMTVARVTGADAQVPLHLAMVEDITKRKDLEDQLRQAQKMEAIGRLAGGVAHDFNNMLTVILGQAQVALLRTSAGHPLYEGLVQIERTAKRSAALTQQLLAFARKQTISPKVLDLNAVLNTMLNMIQSLIGEDINLVWLPGEGLWAVEMDPVQVDQILANLCLNARDAIAGVGSVVIRTSNVTLDEAYCVGRVGFVPGEFVRLSVTDDGCGMDSETLACIFEPFYTTKGLPEGTGLGLATVYGIVKQNRGAITVCSDPGQPTTFEIYIPRHVGELGEVEPDSPGSVQLGRGEQVLVVEDNPSVLELAKTMLECLGYKVLAANSPVKALRLAAEHPGELHLFLSDVVMPGMNGRELSQRLRETCPTVKTLFMSGYTDDVIAREGVLEAGMNFIQKPFSMHDLAAAVRELLDRG